MNKEYVCINGNVVVTDNKGNQSIYKYQNNINDIFIEENLIEVIKSKIKELEIEKNKHLNDKKPVFRPVCSTIVVSLTFITNFAIEYLINGSISYNPVNHNLSGASDILFLNIVKSLVYTFPIGLFCDYSLYIEKNNAFNRGKDINLELFYLRNLIKEEKNKLQLLRNDNSKDNECSQLKIIEIDDRNAINCFENKFSSYKNVRKLGLKKK